MRKQCNFCFGKLSERDQLTGLHLCQDCYSQLEFIHLYKGDICLNCQKKVSYTKVKDKICDDCKYWKSHLNQMYIPNKALLYYNEFAHTLMERLKFQGDIVLWESLLPLFQMFSFFSKIEIQKIPSSELTYQNRDFDHLSYILKYTGAKTTDILQKKENITSQIRLNDVHERRKLKDAFRLKGQINVSQLILFDDVYTTGSTLKDCQMLLEKHQIQVIQTLTIFRSDLR